MAFTANYKTFSYLLLFAIYISANVLIFLGLDSENDSIEPVMEGLTASLGVMTLVALMLLFRTKTFKNAIIFEIVNIVLCSLAVSLIIFYTREPKFNKSAPKNISYLVLVAVSVLISGMILFDDVFNFGMMKTKEESILS